LKHIALALAACQKGFSVRFTTAASLAHELIEAKDERLLMRFSENAYSLRVRYAAHDTLKNYISNF
jgi:DNA replication protein DnaC